MRTFRIVAFWAILAALIGSLIIYGKCQAHPAYDEQGNIVWETLEDHASVEEIRVMLGNGEPAVSTRDEVSQLDIVSLLRECLDYIEDGSIDQGRNLSLSLGVYHPITRDGVAQDEADRAAYEAERYRWETELNKKIKAMIKRLEGENK